MKPVVPQPAALKNLAIKGRRRLAGLPKRTRGALLFALIFAIAGVGYLVASHADTPTYTIALYRLVKGSDHFYTTSSSEALSAESLGYTYESAYPMDYELGQPSIPVYRLNKPATTDHFYTVSSSEVTYAESIGYTYEGVAFYSYGTSGTPGPTPPTGYCRAPWYRLVKGVNHFYTPSSSEVAYDQSIGFTVETTDAFTTDYPCTDPTPPPPTAAAPAPSAPTLAPTAVSWGSGRVDVFERGADNNIYHKYYSNGWSGWENLGGATYDAPAVASWGSGRLDLFIRGTDNAIYHKWYQDGSGWSGWEAVSGGNTTYSAPTAVSWGSGRIDLVVRGTDNNVYHKYYQNGWSGWEAISYANTTYDAPAISSWAPGRLDVFVRGTDNVIYHKWYQSGWSGWESLGGATYSAPTAVSWGSGRIDLFVRGTDNSVAQKWYQNGWSNWVGISGPGTTYSAPSVSTWGVGRLDLFVNGTDNNLYHKYYSSGWSGWENLGVPSIAPPVPPPAPTVTFHANLTTLKYSADTVLSWNATNASGCTASGAWSGSKSTSGSYTTNALISNSNFGLTCSGSGGSSTQAVNIQVLPSSPATTINGYPAAPGATFADIGDGSGFPNLNESPSSNPLIVACAPGYYGGYCPTGLWWKEAGGNGPNGYGKLLTYVNSGNPAGLWVDDETPCNTAQPPSATYPNGLAAEPSGNTTVNTTVNGKTVYSKACVQLWVSYIRNNLGYSLPIYAGVAVSWPVSSRYSGGTALFEWYPQSCGYSGNPPSGAQGYIVNRFFSGGAGSGCNGPAPSYSQFLNLWNAAANNLYNSNISAVNYNNATVGWY
ncbi:MAG TPA: hypothetical protein VH234_04260 [Candidatus Saccharimonadales bacterium]|jgi:hypothetical protein|nr:hypothetical protein [Candidatus Saccharimonadales bacterium]